jgi:hypothetical protein
MIFGTPLPTPALPNTNVFINSSFVTTKSCKSGELTASFTHFRNTLKLRMKQGYRFIFSLYPFLGMLWISCCPIGMEVHP